MFQIKNDTQRLRQTIHSIELAMEMMKLQNSDKLQIISDNMISNNRNVDHHEKHAQNDDIEIKYDIADDDEKTEQISIDIDINTSIWISMAGISFRVEYYVESIAKQFLFETNLITMYGMMLLLYPICTCASEVITIYWISQVVLLCVECILFVKEYNRMITKRSHKCGHCKLQWFGRLLLSLIALYILFMNKSTMPLNCVLNIDYKEAKLYALLFLAILESFVKLKTQLNNDITQSDWSKNAAKLNDIMNGQSQEELLCLKQFVEIFETREQERYDFWAKIASIKYPLQISLSLMYGVVNNLMELVYDECETCENNGEFFIRWLTFGLFFCLPVVLYVFYDNLSRYYSKQSSETKIKNMAKYLASKIIEMIVLLCAMNIYSAKPLSCYFHRNIVKVGSFSLLVSIFVIHGCAICVKKC